MAGVDSANLFPNSFMAKAVKQGESRMVSDDFPSRIQLPSQENVSIAAAQSLSIPSGSTSPPGTTVNNPPTYAVITAVGGPLYVTYDGSTPSSVNYAISLAAGASLPVQGAAAIAAIKVQGTNMSVSYWS
jgi:hypothetical protein